MKNPTILNVVSGKGGTGKTLMVCVLADMLGNTAGGKTIVVDLDFFVRGLTSLLYFHNDERLQITTESEVTVADFFAEKSELPIQNLAVMKYRSFDVVPAVSHINEELNLEDIGPNTRSEARTTLSALLASLGGKYDFIILDSRAGFDELIAAAHDLSTASICIEEQDPISRVTSDNLIAQLKHNSRNPTFRLTNKARGIHSYKNNKHEIRTVTDLGAIPFDMDIMNEFGSPNFWDTVSRSLYRSALANAWNLLSSKLQLGVNLSIPRISPTISTLLEGRIGILGLQERILFIYGASIAATGIIYGLFGREILETFEKEPLRLASLILGLFGVLITIYAFIRRR